MPAREVEDFNEACLNLCVFASWREITFRLPSWQELPLRIHASTSPVRSSDRGAEQ
jgi:hypothetical protein